MSGTTLDLNAKPADILEALKAAGKRARSDYDEDWTRALRRLPGFLEDDTSNRSDGGDRYDSDSTARMPEKRTVSAINLAYRNYISFLARALPRFRNMQGIAASREPRDIRAAYVMQRMLKNELLGHRGAHSDQLLRMISFVFNCHTSYMVVEGVVPKGDEYGEVETSALSPFDLSQYPGVQGMRNSPAVCVTQRLTKEYIEKRWEKLPENAHPAEYADDLGQETASGIEFSLYQIDRLFILPNKKYPNGAQFVFYNDKLLWTMKNDEDKDWIGTRDNKYPIEEVTDAPLGYYDYGASRMALIQAPQRLYNMLYSRFIEYCQKAPTAMVVGGQNVNPDEITNRTIATLTNRGPGPAPQLQVTPMPSYLVEGMAVCERQIENIHAQHAPSRGAPIGTRTPVGTTQALIQQAEGQDYLLIERLRDGISRIGERIVYEGQNVWAPERTFLVLGAHRKYEAAEFKKADLQHGFSMRIRADDGLPTSLAERWDKVTKALQSGLFGPNNPQGTEDGADASMVASQRARKLLQVLDDDEEYSYDQVHRKCAMDHWLLILEGQASPVSRFHNHQVHVQAEAEYAVERMAETGQPLPPEVEVLALEHKQAHIEQQQQVNADALAMSTPPPPEETPGAEGSPDAMPAEGALPEEMSGTPLPEAGVEMEAGGPLVPPA